MPQAASLPARVNVVKRGPPSRIAHVSSSPQHQSHTRNTRASLCRETPTEAPIGPAMSKRRADPTTAHDSAATSKKFRSVIDESIDELMCPITFALPLDPVMAEDGKIYERSAIEAWLKQHDRSPVTNVAMGKKLLPTLQVKNMIERMVKSGAVPGEKVADWKQRIEQQEKVEEKRGKAEAGDCDAMFALAKWYHHGKMGLSKDLAKAFHYFERAAKAGHKHAMGTVAHECFYGNDAIDKNLGLALRWASAGAALGSPEAAEILSEFYYDGLLGIPKDDQEGFRLFKTACEVGVPTSQGCIEIASFYELGRGTAIDIEKAAEWMRKAIAANTVTQEAAVQAARTWLSTHGHDPRP